MVPEAPWTVRQALHTRAFWLLTFGFLLTSMPGGTIVLNISGLAQSLGFSRAIASSMVAVYGVSVLFGRPVWGILLARAGIYRTLVAFAATYSVMIAVVALQSSLVGLYVTIFCLGLAIAGGQQINAQALPDYYGRKIVGTLTGFSQVANIAVGGSGPLLTAAVFDATGGSHRRSSSSRPLAPSPRSPSSSARRPFTPASRHEARCAGDGQPAIHERHLPKREVRRRSA